MSSTFVRLEFKVNVLPSKESLDKQIIGIYDALVEAGRDFIDTSSTERLDENNIQHGLHDKATVSGLFKLKENKFPNSYSFARKIWEPEIQRDCIKASRFPYHTLRYDEKELFLSVSWTISHTKDAETANITLDVHPHSTGIFATSLDKELCLAKPTTKEYVAFFKEVVRNMAGDIIAFGLYFDGEFEYLEKRDLYEDAPTARSITPFMRLREIEYIGQIVCVELMKQHVIADFWGAEAGVGATGTGHFRVSYSLDRPDEPLERAKDRHSVEIVLNLNLNKDLDEAKVREKIRKAIISYIKSPMRWWRRLT